MSPRSLACLVLLLLPPAPAAVAGEDSGVFVLPPFADLGAVRYDAAALRSHRLVVLAWTALDCPMAKLYRPRLKALARELGSRSVAFFLVDSNAGEGADALRASVREDDPGFPVLADLGGVLARRLLVTRTTEVLVLGPVDGRPDAWRVRYRGAVDDQYGFRRTREGGAGTWRRDSPRHAWLRDALGRLLDGKDPDPAVTDPLGCPVDLAPEAGEAPDIPAGAVPTFHETIEPLLAKHCQECHRTGGAAPFPLVSFADAAQRARRVQEVVVERRMPPWSADPGHGEFANDPSLPNVAVEAIVAWARAGAPRGDPGKAPPPRAWPDGYWFGEPDAVFATPPCDVPAEGTLPYRYVRVRNDSPDDRWVEAADVRSSAAEVVHHVLILLETGPAPAGSPRPYRPPFNPWSLLQGADPSEYPAWVNRFRRYIRRDLFVGDGGGLNGYFLATAAGARGLDYPKGRAKLLPRQSTLVFQIHYTPVGRAIAGEVTTLALRFAKAPPGEVVDTHSIATVVFEIPPGAREHRVEAGYALPRKGRLLALQPHMHLRGKSFRFVARLPDGKEDVLLDVPRYDFDWQHRYILARPLVLPAGAELRAIGTFDNSAANPYNPDPTRAVGFGLQTDEEMMIGYFEIAWGGAE